MTTNSVTQDAERETECWLKLAEARVPEHLRGGLMRYLLYRIPPGHFLMAVLENNLSEAMGRADLASRAGLFEIVSFLYNDAPATAWGNPEKVAAWLNGGDE